MNILLTNDDGFEAEGLNCLREVLTSYSHNVWVVAPLKNKSGASSSITMYTKLVFEKKEENVFALDGTPVDCVIAAIKGDFLPCKPDVVFSGINRDGNLGTDIVYSGTCAASRQASLYGIPGIALSSESKGESRGREKVFKYKALSEFAAENLELLIELCGEKKSVMPFYVNVNAPSEDSFSGVKFTSPCTRMYGDKVEITKENGVTYSNCMGGTEILSLGDGNDDNAVVSKKMISITALKTEPAWDNSSFLDKQGLFKL